MDDQLRTDRKVFFLVLVCKDFITAFVLDYTNSFNNFCNLPFLILFIRKYR